MWGLSHHRVLQLHFQPCAWPYLCMEGPWKGILGVERLEVGRPGRDGTPARPNDAKVWTRTQSNALEGESDRKYPEDGEDRQHLVVAFGVPVRDPHWKLPFFSEYHAYPRAARCGRSLVESQNTKLKTWDIEKVENPIRQYRVAKK